VRGGGGAADRERAGLERRDERQDADVQHHHGEDELDQPESLLLPRTRRRESRVGARTRPLKALRPSADTNFVASFAYSAINAQGAELSGEIHAPDLSAARAHLRVKGLLAQSIKELADAGSGLGQTSIGNKKVKPKS